MKEKCIILFSNGLDSRLATKIMKEKNFKIILLYFKLPFSKNCEEEVKKFSKKEKTQLKILDCTKGKLFQEYLKIIENPKFHRGTALNPCIDCKIFMFQKVKKFADKQKIKYIVSGEVLGQRPMSQTKKAIELIEKESKLNGRILRPVSKIVQGRKRGKQIAIAKSFKMDYPTPAGGCLLCEKLYCKKLKNILKNKKINFKKIELLKIGRHFENSKIILGRDEKENKLLEKEKGIKIISKQPGPSAWIQNKKLITKAKKLIQKYSKKEIKDFEIKI